MTTKSKPPARKPARAVEAKVPPTPKDFGGPNPVGVLFEMNARARPRSADPFFEFFTAAGEPHRPVFRCECNALGKRDVGHGPTKQAAKAEAARKVLEQL